MRCRRCSSPASGRRTVCEACRSIDRRAGVQRNAGGASFRGKALPQVRVDPARAFGPSIPDGHAGVLGACPWLREVDQCDDAV